MKLIPNLSVIKNIVYRINPLTEIEALVHLKGIVDIHELFYRVKSSYGDDKLAKVIIPLQIQISKVVEENITFSISNRFLARQFKSFK